MSSSTRASRKEKDRSSRHSEKKRDDGSYKESTPRVLPPLEEEFAGLQIDSSGNELNYATGQGKGNEKLEDWSDWEWNQEYSCYYRYRKNSLGDWEYDYNQTSGENLSDNQSDVC
jgi:hypothetical protein